MSRKEALTQFIQQIHGRPVVVKLNSGVDYRGIVFHSFIIYFNLFLNILYISCFGTDISGRLMGQSKEWVFGYYYIAFKLLYLKATRLTFKLFYTAIFSKH